MRRPLKQTIFGSVFGSMLLLGAFIAPLLRTPAIASAFAPTCATSKEIYDIRARKCITNPDKNCNPVKSVWDSSKGKKGCTDAKTFSPTCPSGQIFLDDPSSCVKNTFGCDPSQIYDPTDGCEDLSVLVNGTSGLVTCPDGKTQVPSGTEAKNCPAISGTDAAASGGNCSQLNMCDVIHDYISPAINFLAAGVGVAIVISIIIGGIEYGSSGGDSQKVTSAKARIRNAIIALAAFALLYAMLNFLLPGGLNASLLTYDVLRYYRYMPLALLPLFQTVAAVATSCSKPSLFGLIPWYAFLNVKPDSSGVCSITNFDDPTGVLGAQSPFLLIALAILEDLIRVAALIAVGYIIYGGIQYVVSQGAPDSTKKAQSTIINALIGLTVAIMATSIVAYIGHRLGS